MDQINFRCSKEMKLYLLSMENYSEYVRALIDKDRIELCNPEHIKIKISEHETIIKQLKDSLKGPKLDQERIKGLCEYHAPSYQENAMYREEKQRYNFIRKTIQPDLKLAGYKGDLKDIDKLLINYPIKNKVAVEI